MVDKKGKIQEDGWVPDGDGGFVPDPNEQPHHDDLGGPHWYTPGDWGPISSGLQTSNMNNGRWNMRRYAPWYNDLADYNTDAKSYYDYLSRLNYLLDVYRDAINQLLRREIQTADTTTIHETQNGNWETEDDILLQNFVKISKQFHDFSHELPGENGQPQTIDSQLGNAIYDDSNGVVDDSHGVYAPDYSSIIGQIENDIQNIYNKLIHIQQEIDDINQQITEIWKHINKIESDIKNIYNILDGLMGHFHSLGHVGVEFENGWGADNGAPCDVGWVGSDSQVTVHLSFKNSDVKVHNGNLGANVSLAHGNYDNSKALICTIGIPGPAGDNINAHGMKLNSVEQSGNELWNIKPGGLGQSFTCAYGVRQWGGSSIGIFASSYQGFNDFGLLNKELKTTCSTSGINMDLTLRFFP